MRIAVLGLGSPSFRLSVYDRLGPTDVPSLRWSVVSDAPGLIRAGRIDGVGQARALATVDDLLARARPALGDVDVVGVATGELAAAANARVLLAEVARRHGVVVAPLTPEAEARLRFAAVAPTDGAGEPLACADLRDGVLALAAGDATAEVVYHVALSSLLGFARDGGRGADGRARLEAAVRFVLAGAARAVWARAPRRLVLTCDTGALLAAAVDELAPVAGRCAGAIELAALRRATDALWAASPLDLGLAATVLGTTMELVGLSRAVARPLDTDALSARAAGSRPRAPSRSGRDPEACGAAAG